VTEPTAVDGPPKRGSGFVPYEVSPSYKSTYRHSCPLFASIARRCMLPFGSHSCLLCHAHCTFPCRPP
jgi:hypothetical protein